MRSPASLGASIVRVKTAVLKALGIEPHDAPEEEVSPVDQAAAELDDAVSRLRRISQSLAEQDFYEQRAMRRRRP